MSRMDGYLRPKGFIDNQTPITEEDIDATTQKETDAGRTNYVKSSEYRIKH